MNNLQYVDFRENCYLREGITLHDTAFVVEVGANVGLFEPAAPFTFFRDIPGSSTRYPEEKNCRRKLLAAASDSFIHQIFGEGGLVVTDLLTQDKLEEG